jgi:hypothetical protein
LKFELKQPMTVVSRVKGTNGRTRELNAVLDTSWHYSYIMKMDALQLGYQEVMHRPQEWQSLKPDEVSLILGTRGLEMCTLITLAEVSVGDAVAKNVGAVVPYMEFPSTIPVDLILGRTFLNNFTLTIEAKTNSFSLT